MPEVAFVMPPGLDHPLREFVRSIEYELGRQGVITSERIGSFPVPRPRLVYVLVAPRAYVAELGPAALPGDALLNKTIVLSAEPPEAVGESDELDVLSRAGAVFTVHPRSAVALQRQGIRALALRPGYAPSRDRFDPGAERPIDVMFLGTPSPRRTRYLERAARILARHNCRLQPVPDVPRAGETASPEAEGQGSLLAETKVLISLHCDDSPTFDWMGAVEAMQAGAVVVSEPAGGMAPFVAGEHLLVAAPDALPYIVKSLLGDPARLARLRSQAYERLRDWVPLALPVGVLRAAIVELVGRPVAPDGFRGDAPPGQLLRR